ncbi:MAG: hypothetical protein JNK07_02670 [Alphaproteobacteria bacterium]|nr:hypothetical protein [Alphaproteobacteria bacterium]
MTSEPAPQVFDRETLRARLRDYNVVVFQIASSLVQSGVLALAAIVLIDILYAERDQAILLLLWLASFVFAVLSFERQLYLPLATPRGGVGDVWPLMLLGLAQFVNFACLSPRTNGEAPWELWYFSTTASAIMGAAAVWQAARFANLDDYEPALRPVGEMLVAWLKHDLMELKIVAAVSLALSVVVASSILPTPAFEWVTIGAALVGIFGNAWLVRRDGQRFWELYSKVYALPASRTTGEKS